MALAVLFPPSARHRIGLLVLLLVACLAGGSPLSASTDEEQQRALLDLVVNEVSRGQVVAIVRGTDVLLPVAVLEQASLGGFGGRRETIDTQAWVSLASLAPGITYKLDDRALTLRITASASFLSATTRLDLRDVDRPAFERRRDTSAFLNYAFNWRQAAGAGATGEAGLSVRGAFASSTFSWSEARGAVRGLSSITFDQLGRRRRVVVGDTFLADSQLGGSLFVGGVRVASEYSIDPYFLRYPTLGLSGVATLPSSLDVYVNDRLVRSEQLTPGRFEVANLAVPVGSNQTRLVLRDAFGREQQVSRSFYLASTVLARGLHDYEYAVGAARGAMATSSWDYGALSMFARHRYGFSDVLTAGVRVEGRNNLLSGGPSLNARLPVGELEVAAAASRTGGRGGTAASLAYTYTGRVVSGGLTYRGFGNAYATLSSEPIQNAVRREANAFAGLQLAGYGSLTLQHGRTENRQGDTSLRTSLFGTARLARYGNVFFSVARSVIASRTLHEFSVGLSVVLGPRTSASVSLLDSANGTTAGIEAQRSLPIGTGYGYRLRAASGPGEGSGGRFLYQTSFGRYEVERETLGGSGTSAFSLSGGLATLGGRVLPTRPVDQGFALVRVPGVEGVRTYLSNQEIGRTDRHGDLLVPNLLPYYANRLSVADQDIPIDRSISGTERRVAPPLRGGALVLFAASQVRSITGRIELEVDGRLVVPEFGDVAVETAGRRVASPIGRDGEYYLENLAPGVYPGEVSFQGAHCGVTLRVPAADGPVVDLGVSRCVVRNPQ